MSLPIEDNVTYEEDEREIIETAGIRIIKLMNVIVSAYILSPDAPFGSSDCWEDLGFGYLKILIIPKHYEYILVVYKQDTAEESKHSEEILSCVSMCIVKDIEIKDNEWFWSGIDCSIESLIMTVKVVFPTINAARDMYTIVKREVDVHKNLYLGNPSSIEE
ncbi:uncharacterized protein LOC114255137 [Monomorium pharaonis]|uniref:uncharacterized protein LOC114255137 n=1 Tax=Monomorium pharaonis TaxID=307658 RepID=UPI00102E1780|nr:uncharacterized protein LOC114255137 [Monomorium pharaonis]XP_036139420.1 uncharacterized protein LOC114255137 [Monomorium pharaonis]